MNLQPWLRRGLQDRQTCFNNYSKSCPFPKLLKVAYVFVEYDSSSIFTLFFFFFLRVILVAMTIDWRPDSPRLEILDLTM